MHASPPAPMPVSIAYAHYAPVCAPTACPVPIAACTLPAVVHWPVRKKKKIVNFLASIHDQVIAHKTIPGAASKSGEDRLSHYRVLSEQTYIHKPTQRQTHEQIIWTRLLHVVGNTSMEIPYDSLSV